MQWCLVGEIVYCVQYVCYDECDGQQVDVVDYVVVQDGYQYSYCKEWKCFKVILLCGCGMGCYVVLLCELFVWVVVVVLWVFGFGDVDRYDWQYCCYQNVLEGDWYGQFFGCGWV